MAPMTLWKRRAVRLAPDVQAALAVVSRRTGEQRLDLRRLDLRGADLNEARFAHAKLAESDAWMTFSASAALTDASNK